MEGVASPERLGEFRLADGRTLGWSEWGPVDGRPVLLCPGAATSRRLGFGTELVHPLGVRLVSVDRPGLGVSTPAPERTIADFAVDVEQLAEGRGWTSPVVIGNSQGAPFALACAVAGLASALYLVSAADEIGSPHFAGMLGGHLATVVDLCGRNPRAAYEQFLSFDADSVRKMVVENSGDRDTAVYTDPVFDAAYREALREGFAQGAGGYATDTVLAMRPWQLDLDRVSCPVEIWYGEEDTSHSPDNGVTLTSRVPGASRRSVPDGGGSLLWTHSETLLRRVTT
ncbi:alpha/beta fold hydrolase [Saccharomonospora cyanea]|uniref:Putative hydrolase or acyltransferase of alpha/beta superfamily n=1 Tax=Saccharomonospora cyanea NA-134 TaxID=882082 RepID=H5XQG4_9PSEU|nr:alpha/beta hydrolase [Saccharomonospora cyanea]EHR59010.1 putative hydrolase or acyltransferase of alpha/beta superfamily [Saccharomonospora cyanea NA-134]